MSSSTSRSTHNTNRSSWPCRRLVTSVVSGQACRLRLTASASLAVARVSCWRAEAGRPALRQLLPLSLRSVRSPRFFLRVPVPSLYRYAAAVGLVARRLGVAFEQRVLGLRVKRGGRLVEHQQERVVAHEAACERELLP